MLKPASIDAEIQTLAFDLLYWFSRFEFAMKEAVHLKSTKPGAIAQANWDGFLVESRNRYDLTAAGSALIEVSPQVQIVTEGGFDFSDFEF